MSQFENVTVLTKANVYFDGKVTSRTLVFADGSKKTLGVMLPGQFQFSTDTKEIMEFYSGDLTVLLPGETEWKPFGPGTQFEVPAGAIFKLDVKSVTDYCCSFG
ncbi:pyrimidine/purine nucleoside phosphorylase [Paenibacillus koleovorans]|uniref:pyrimidine/purine nucleoside phosphorylase n=1 Tax=Paenibacillus koleovorans TaxID=121608 RepID=UPI000FD7D8F7|nr:pyrimidine/purine nucleoside phosphorylase [Paenibacillus koleovorans]